MHILPNIPVYAFIFMSLYFQVFLLVTFLEKRRAIAREETDDAPPAHFPSVTIVVPCYNEAATVEKTMDSLFALNYPKEKLFIHIVDDGSKDNTWEVIQQYNDHPQVVLSRKENGGKHTALNHALSLSSTDLIGCLDADSFVEADALMRIAKGFEDSTVMAVTPAIKLESPRTVLELIQNVEYNFGIFFRKMMGTLDAIQVTPGPFSVFRKKVFDDLGPYRAAHNTEDLELAFRMHQSHYRIVNSHKAFVRTVAPKTLRGLYKQRLRWASGFLKNSIDYRHLFFRRKYGNFGMFMLPAAVVSVFSVLYLTAFSLAHFADYLAGKIVEWNTVGFSFRFDWFYFDAHFMTFLSFILFTMVLTMVVLGKWIAEDMKRVPLDIVYFMVLYGFIVPSWLFMAVYNTAFSRKGAAWIDEKLTVR